MSSLSPSLRLPGLVAALLFVLAVIGFGAGLTATHKPVIRWHCWARRGAACAGLQSAGLRAAGLLAAIVAECLRRGLPATAGWAPRVWHRCCCWPGWPSPRWGCCRWMWMTHGPASQLHASAWMIWVLGLSPEPCCWPAACAGALAWRWAAACWPRWPRLPCRAYCGAAGTTAGVCVLGSLAGRSAAVAPTLRRLPGRRGACLRRAGLETFAALRYAVPLCRRIRVFHDQR